MFTTPCFIRKNTPELRRKLEELGYECLMCDDSEDCVLYTKLTHKGAFYVGTFYINERHPQCPFDCEDNEELFLALVALRDDSDANQWFTDGTTWMKASELTVNDNPIKDYSDLFKGLHKATKDELINHFKK